MSVPATRYPGAQPFSDDALSRRVFSGREREVTALTDQILANRMVVVYARSGLGKSSLLNAGVAQRLRDEGYLPLIVRVNDIQEGPRTSVLQGIGAAAQRQEIEYVAGDPVSLWSFFKTAEFWRGDLLMTPVLILDQFEELFTLQGPQARMNFLSELGYLVRGVSPPNFAEAHPDLSDAAPAVRVVISLREDFLGLLEEATDHIPQILDHRFRLNPLSVHAAAEALIGPAAIDDLAFETKPFRYDPHAVESILNYLSRRRVRTLVETIEPFQLQLICQRFERIALERQRQSAHDVILTIKDIGGEAALRDTLKNFYGRVLAALPGGRVRKAVRRLCESFLISPEGRRLSFEENEIRRQLGLSTETLRYLVSNRLLRCDSRADSIYYELSHDALIEPVLATRQARGILFGSLGVVAGGISWLITLALVILFVAFITGGFINKNFASPPDWTKNIRLELGSIISVALAIVGMITLSKLSYSGGLRTVRRYFRSEQTELVEPLISSPNRLLLGWSAIVVGGFWFSVSDIFLFLMVALLGSYLGVGPPEFFEGKKFFYEHGPGLDMGAAGVAALANLLLGAAIVNWGYRRVSLRQPTGFEQLIAVQRGRKALLFGCLSIIGGGIAMLAFMFWAIDIFIDVGCMSYMRGGLPNWAPSHWWSVSDKLEECQTMYKKGFSLLNSALNIFICFGLLTFAVNWLFRGIRSILNFLGRSSGNQNIRAELR